MSDENAQAASQDAQATEGAAALAAAQASDAEGAQAAAAVDAAVSGDTPTPEEARAAFAERPDAAGCLTTEGWMRRDGTFPS